MTTLNAQRDERTYLLGHESDELQRLIDQSRYFGDLTEHLLLLAGLEPGMRVLDVGCGPGDVSFLAARIVGPDGAVVGVDRAADATRLATERAKRAGLSNVSFINHELSDLVVPGSFDALIGRLVLMYLNPAASALRQLLRFVRPGGIVAFMELDADIAKSAPRCALFEATLDRVRNTFTRAGSDPCFGLRLSQVFREAGLPTPQLRLEARVESGPESGVFDQIARITATLLPLMENLGIATAYGIGMETLAARMREEARASGATYVSPALVGAWTTKPA